MKSLLVAALCAGQIMALAQTDERSLPAFNKITTDIPVKLKLVKNNQEKVAHAKNLNRFSFKVDNQVLEIGYQALEEESIPDDNKLTLYFNELNSIEVNGAGEVYMEQGHTIKSDQFELEARGAAKADLDLTVGKVKVVTDGASSASMKGTADAAKVQVNGASKYNAVALRCNSVDIVANGASYFTVFASNELIAEVSGASKGIYSGNPVSRKVNISGASKLVDAGTGESMEDERNSGDDTTRITVGKKKLIIIEEDNDIRIETEEETLSHKPGKYDLKKVYAGFELGMSQLTQPGLNFSLPANYSYLECVMEKSWFFGLNLLEGDLQLVRNKLALTSGLGMEFLNLNFNSDQVLVPNMDLVQADSGNIALSKNKMYNYNLNVPFLIKFAPRTKKDRNNFHIAVGVIGTFKAYSHIRVESSFKGYEEELKRKDDFGINPFRLTATARIGYGWFRAFANYSLTPYFKTDSGNPDIRVFSAGITLIPFQ